MKKGSQTKKLVIFAIIAVAVFFGVKKGILPNPFQKKA